MIGDMQLIMELIALGLRTNNDSIIENELNWRPKKEFNEALFLTVNWYLDNIKWTEKMIKSSQYNIQRLGLEIN